MTEDSSRPWRVVPCYLPSGKLNPDFPGYVAPTKTPRNSPEAEPVVQPSAPVISSLARRPVPAEPPYVRLEPAPPLSAFNDDPLFRTHDAAVILGLTEDCLKKWRQRGAGPTYIQYRTVLREPGPVRYALSALMQFRENHTVRAKEKKQK